MRVSIAGLLLVPLIATGSLPPGTAADAAPAGWAARAPLAVARGAHSVATADGQILVFSGGVPGGDPFASVEARGVRGAGTWHSVAPIPTPRGNSAAADLDGSAYVAGGYATDGSTSDVVEKYTPRTGRWTTSTKLPARVAAAGAASLGHRLYVAGGYIPIGDDEETVTASVIAFGPAKRNWTAVAPLPTARARLRLVAAGGRLYAIGGQTAEGDTLSTVDRYNPGSNTWTTVAPMNEDRGVPGAVAVRNGIAVIGGCHFAGGELLAFRRTTEVYDLRTGRWRLLPARLPEGRCTLGAAAEAGGSILAIGGVTDATGTPTALNTVSALRL
jgi:N-acetylneuraminic acid mutarotase